MRVVLFTVAVAAAGCVADSTDSTEQRDEVDEAYECECKIEGSQIGQVGVRVHSGDLTITFMEWIPKVDSPGEYVGFLLSANAEDSSYVVKTGGDRYAGTGRTWLHPNGDYGPDVPGISYVDLCPPEGEPPPEDIPDVD
jgi:hypothetical protein